MKPCDAKSIIALFDRLTTEWHDTQKEVDDCADAFLKAAVEIHRFNYLLWHEEDKARVRDVPDAEIARVKRAIDGHNQNRNDRIEAWDERLIHWLNDPENGVNKAETTAMNSETPGSMVDRLSIMALKHYHMMEQTQRDDVDAAHLDGCREKVKVLDLQRHDLGDCFDALLGDLITGNKHLRVYFQFKMYNDPTLNPEVYQRKNA